jgi:hypothetical protein
VVLFTLQAHDIGCGLGRPPNPRHLIEPGQSTRTLKRIQNKRWYGKEKKGTFRGDDGILQTEWFCGSCARPHRRKRVHKKVHPQNGVTFCDTHYRNPEHEARTGNRLWTEIIDASTCCMCTMQTYRCWSRRTLSATATILVRRFLQGNPDTDLRRRLRCRPYPPWQSECAPSPDCFLKDWNLDIRAHRALNFDCSTCRSIEDHGNADHTWHRRALGESKQHSYWSDDINVDRY